MTENIVQFPNQSLDTFPSNIEESIDHIQSIRQEYCDEVVSDTLDAIIAVLNSYGFTIQSNKEAIKDIVFVEETLKAFVYRYKRLEHPFHEIIEQAITLPDDIQEQINKKTTEKKLT